jgi:hypothetical protein
MMTCPITGKTQSQWYVESWMLHEVMMSISIFNKLDQSVLSLYLWCLEIKLELSFKGQIVVFNKSFLLTWKLACWSYQVVTRLRLLPVHYPVVTQLLLLVVTCCCRMPASANLLRWLAQLYRQPQCSAWGEQISWPLQPLSGTRPSPQTSTPIPGIHHHTVCQGQCSPTQKMYSNHQDSAGPRGFRLRTHQAEQVRRGWDWGYLEGRGVGQTQPANLNPVWAGLDRHPASPAVLPKRSKSVQRFGFSDHNSKYLPDYSTTW